MKDNVELQSEQRVDIPLNSFQICLALTLYFFPVPFNNHNSDNVQLATPHQLLKCFKNQWQLARRMLHKGNLTFHNGHSHHTLPTTHCTLRTANPLCIVTAEILMNSFSMIIIFKAALFFFSCRRITIGNTLKIHEIANE